MLLGQKLRCFQRQAVELIQRGKMTCIRSYLGLQPAGTTICSGQELKIKPNRKGSHHQYDSQRCFSYSALDAASERSGLTRQLYQQKHNGQPVVFQTPTRSKHKKYNKGLRETQEKGDEDTDSEEYTEELDKDALDPQDRSKEVVCRVSSLRVDVIFKSGHKLSRNKAEENFYQSRLRLNGDKVLKKSIQVSLGDEIDLVKGMNAKSDKYIDVMRVHVVGIKLPQNSESKFVVKMRCYKHLTIENYPDAWTGSYIEN